MTEPGRVWKAGRHRLPIGKRTLVMGIVNVTPDSFSDGGRFLDADAAVAHGLRLVEEGADLLDVGGESTRPGAAAVDAKEELARVVPVVEGLVASGVPVSVDTMKADVALAALEAGASIVNDVTALRHDPALADVVAASKAGVVLMHMQGTPRTMQDAPTYVDVVSEVRDFLAARAAFAVSRGVEPASIVLDPGIGFGKTLTHNLALVRGLDEVRRAGYPVLLGHSRKSFLGRLLGDAPVGERLEGGLAAAVLGASFGADVVRVHDVAETAKALRVADAILGRVEP